jgi:hypothetical protein
VCCGAYRGGRLIYSSSLFRDSTTEGSIAEDCVGIQDCTRFSARERDMSTVLWMVSGSMSSSASRGCVELDAIDASLDSPCKISKKY